MQSEFRKVRRENLSNHSTTETYCKHVSFAIDDKENKDSINLRRPDTDSQLIMQVRKDAVSKLKELTIAHQQEVKELQDKHAQEIHALTNAYQKELSDKDQYIRMLEQMIEGEAGGLVNFDPRTSTKNLQPIIAQGKTADFAGEKHAEAHCDEVQLTNRLYLGAKQPQPHLLNRQSSLARRKSKSMFIAEKVSKHSIAPMCKPKHPQIQS